MSENRDGAVEPLLDPRNARDHLLPIRDRDLWDMYRISKAAFWVPEEVDLTQDVKDWAVLTQSEQTFMKTVFAFLAVFDQLVIKHLESDFVSQITIVEAQMFYRFQEAIEDIHVHMYSLFPEKLVKDEVERDRIVNALRTIPSIAKMADWAKRTKNLSFGHRLVAFVIVEGIFFSSIFAAIFYMKKQNKLPGLCHANELIARDEGNHRDEGLLLVSRLINRPPDQDIIAMVKEAVELVNEFNREAAPVDMIGMNSRLMDQYVKFVADCTCVGSTVDRPDDEHKKDPIIIPGLLRGRKIYNVENPFEWMNLISLQGRTNFFDRSVSQYSRSSVLTKPEDNTVRYDADF